MHNDIDLIRGALAGAIGGMVASFMMNHLQATPQQIQARRRAEQAAYEERERLERSHREEQERQQQEGGGEDATVKTAQAISRNLFQHELEENEKRIAGPIVHYGYGALTGGLYGAVSEVWRGVRVGYGMGYGTALFLLGDEVAVPALGLGAQPQETPADKHADALAAHLCYGLTLEIVRKVVRGLLIL